MREHPFRRNLTFVLYLKFVNMTKLRLRKSRCTDWRIMSCSGERFNIVVSVEGCKTQAGAKVYWLQYCFLSSYSNMGGEKSIFLPLSTPVRWFLLVGM